MYWWRRWHKESCHGVPAWTLWSDPLSIDVTSDVSAPPLSEGSRSLLLHELMQHTDCLGLDEACSVEVVASVAELYLQKVKVMNLFTICFSVVRLCFWWVYYMGLIWSGDLASEFWLLSLSKWTMDVEDPEGLLCMDSKCMQWKISNRRHTCKAGDEDGWIGKLSGAMAHRTYA